MSNALIPQEPTSQASAMIAEAINRGMTGEDLRSLLAARREWEADEARKAYFTAISEFQRRAPIIAKKDDAHGGKLYAKMDRIWREIRPLFTELGLSCTWQVCEVRDGLCHVEGQLAHRQGHSVPLVMDVAMPELIKGQNLAQQVGSARTYATRYAFCAATGLQTGEDDDAHVAGTAFVTMEQVEQLLELLGKIPDREAVLASLLEWAECDALQYIPASKFPVARKSLIAKQPKP